MRMRLMRYDFDVKYKPGPQMHTADTLSRDPIAKLEEEDLELEKEISLVTTEVMQGIPCTSNKMKLIKEEQRKDTVLSKVQDLWAGGWSKYQPLEDNLKEFWRQRESLTVIDDLLLKEDRVVIPKSLRGEMLQCIHGGHMES